MKKDAKRKFRFPIWQLCLIVGIGLIGFSAYKLIGISLDYHASNALYEDLENSFVSVNKKPNKKPGASDSSEGNHDGVMQDDLQWYNEISVNLKGLKKRNRDVAGWIYFENMDISYPVLYSGDNTAYLRTDMDKKHSTAGCIFIEGNNNKDFEDSHTIVYGHNMRNLSMFGTLKYFKDKGFYEDHSMFQIFVEGKVYRYQIFAYEDVEETSEIYSVPQAPSDSFQELIDTMYKLSYIKSGVTATKEDKIITLSTCSTTGHRFVLHAVRVDEHEVDTSGEA